MPGSRKETAARAAPSVPRQDRRTACARAPAPAGEGEAPTGAPGPEEGARDGTPGARPERAPSEGLGGALHDLLRGLCAGDLESVLLTVAMAAEENRMPSADPDEAARILGFLARLAEYDAVLPLRLGGAPGDPLGTG